MVARTSAEAMPALSAHWLLSKRHASLMAIFYAGLCNRGTRLRGGQAARFKQLIAALSRRAVLFFLAEPSKRVVGLQYAGSDLGVCRLW